MIAIIGAGVTGSLIARELSRYEKDVVLFEKNFSAGRGVTKSNSGIIHGGYDDPPGSLRASLSRKGNILYTELSEDLNFRINRCGSHVVAFEKKDFEYINKLVKYANTNGVKSYEIIDREQLKIMEPELNGNALGSFFCSDSGVVNPWNVAVSAVTNLQKNGGEVYYDKKLIRIEKINSGFRLFFEDGTQYEADLVINCGGLFADEIAKMAGDIVPEIFPVKGEYYLLKPEKTLTNSVIFPIPDENTKGCLVTPAIDGGYLAGPTAKKVLSKYDNTNTEEGLSEVRTRAEKLVPNINFRKDPVKTFAGLRPETEEKDFYIDVGNSGIIHVSGIRSPGLTAAPAIAKYVTEYIIQEKLGIKLTERPDFDPKNNVRIIDSFETLEEMNSFIKEHPDAGEFVCYCNKVTKYEIKKAIEQGARSIEDIKFLTGASFGECQGGYCTGKIIEIMLQDKRVKPEDIILNEKNSWLFSSEVRI
ncbi:MAG: NAD(P)/FAD-dependent oxidoreductase [Thermotogae bacterium]|nr:NAD(P)/FAD-dependent oxidoreductase [Thermotogota bacterium]